MIEPVSSADRLTDAQPFDADVIVVGAGPIGLTLACALARHGVRFRIFEQKTGQSGDSKAHDLIARSQELLDAIGALELVAPRSYVAPETQIMLDGKPLARLDTRGSNSPHDAVLFTSQGVIEEGLARAVEQAGGVVERGRTVLEVEQDKDGATVTVGWCDAAGREEEGRGPERLRCRYLVGADGIKGVVRKAVGLDFPLEELPGRATRQIDATLSWRRSTDFDQAWFFLYPNGYAGVMPVWERKYRLFFLEEEDAMPEREPTLPEMVARAREVIGDETFDLADPTWFSYGKFSHGIASAYAKGRVFLAGDAGHHTLPIGG